jgi:tetratricopeptide (TPR) repeat protein
MEYQVQSFRICPQCDQHLTVQSHSDLMHCRCGWADPAKERAAKKTLEKRISVYLMASMAVLMMAFSHVVSWGEYSLSAPVLRIGKVAGLLSVNGYNQLAEACLATGRFACAEGAYARSFEEFKLPSEILKLAKLQMRLGENSQSRDSYLLYFKSGGKDQRAMVKLGNLLEAEKNDAKALKVYQQAYLHAMKNSKLQGDLPIEAMSGIVRVLMRQGRHREVYARIIKFHHSSETAKGYLNVELAQVRETIRAKYQRTGNRSVASARGA